MRSLTDADVGALRYFRFLPEQVRFGGAPVVLSRTGFSGELGFEVFLAPEHAQTVWDAVAGAGAVPYGVDIIEAVRVETGMVVTGYDYQEHERTPYDLGPGSSGGARRARRVHGQGPAARGGEAAAEPVQEPASGGGRAARVRRRRHARRRGRGRPDEPGREPEARTSGLAILRTDVAADGTRLEVALGDGTVGATVDQLALYDPKKERPRG